MEKQTYKIKNGEITFDEKSIVIKDDAKKQYRTFVFIYMCGILYGVVSILRYQKTGDALLLWLGLAIVIVNIVVLIMASFKSTMSEIQRIDIVSIRLKQKLYNKFLEIKLKDNKIRRVNQINDVYHELKAYIATHFEDKNRVA